MVWCAFDAVEVHSLLVAHVLDAAVCNPLLSVPEQIVIGDVYYGHPATVCQNLDARR